MKRLFILIIALLNFSCLIQDRKSMIKQILNEKNYTIDWSFQGCFGGATQRIEIKDSKIATITWIERDYPGKPEHKPIQISWNIDKEKLLRKFFEAGINLINEGSCTTSSTYALKGFARTVKFEDWDCSVDDKFLALLK